MPQYFSDSVNGSFLHLLLLCCSVSSSRSFFGRFTVRLSRRVAIDAGVDIVAAADAVGRSDGVTVDGGVVVVSAFLFTPFFVYSCHTITHLLNNNNDKPIAVETLGVLHTSAHHLLADLGRRISINTGDARETSWLFQRISVLVQRFNVFWCMSACRSLTAQTDDRAHLCIAS